MFPKHQHRFVQTTIKSAFEQVNPGNSELYRMVEYAYMVCVSCPDGTSVIKTKVKEEGEDDRSKH